MSCGIVLLNIFVSHLLIVVCIFCRWLKEHNNINIFVEPRVSKELLAEDSYFNFIQTWDNGKSFFVYIQMHLSTASDCTFWNVRI